MVQFVNFFVMQCLLTFRSKIALCWSFVYPLTMLVLMLSVFGDMNKANSMGNDPRLSTLTGVFVLTIMSGGIFGLATVLSADFQANVYNRLKLTDLTRLQVILALVLRQFFVIAVGTILVFSGAKLLFSVTPHGNVSVIMFLTMVGCILFSSIGIVIANICTKPSTTTAIANAVFLVMLFLSGSTFPRTFFPTWLSNAAQVLPASYLFDLLESQLYYGENLIDNTRSLIVLLSMCLALFIAAIITFKWE